MPQNQEIKLEQEMRQSYLDYASGGIDDSTFIQEINKLNKYNHASSTVY